jgi:hypothetical protein
MGFSTYATDGGDSSGIEMIALGGMLLVNKTILITSL